MAAPALKPPVGELSVAVPSWAAMSSAAFGGIPGANVFVDDRETVNDLRWPISVRETFPRMATDSQLKALERGTFLPITRYAWGIDANGASPQIVAGVIADYNLPLIDDAIDEATTGRATKPIARSRNRLSFAKHQLEALRDGIRNGHGYFEHTGTYDGYSDGLWHPRKLAQIPTRTIEQIFRDPDGGLAGIRQGVGLDSETLKVGRLVAYIWDEAERGDWIGTSMYRACFREWLIKDRLLRVDARNHEKGGGSWYGVAGPNSTPREKQAIAQAAADMNTMAGPVPAMPNGSELKFERPGGTTSAIDSINRHDEAMARSWLLMVIQLGSTQTGARAVGDVQQDLWTLALEGISIWFQGVFNEHVIEDYVDWNYGLDQQQYVPRLVFWREKSQPAQLPAAAIDPATAAALNGAPPAKVAALRAQYDRENRRFRAELKRALPQILDADELAALGGVDREDEVEEQLHETLADQAVKPTRGRAAPARAQVSLPSRTLRRQPYDHEVRAATDFAALDRAWQSELDQLIGTWQTVRTSQVDDLRAQIETAAGDLEKLAAVKAATVGSDAIAPVLQRAAVQAAAEAVAEAKRQGMLEAAAPALDDAPLAARSGAVAELLARSLSEAAGRKAVQLSGGGIEPRDVADQVATHLDSLSDTYLRDQFGGAITAAQNTGRFAVMGALNPSRIYASELLDVNCCQPCIAEDGTEFASLAEAAKAYPTGGYHGCQGGPRCRGTLVAVYEEAAPSA